MSTESFYSNLHTFTDFATLGDNRHYETLPTDWFVVITDVRGSTAAIAAGRYQDVNLLGAASVAVLGQLWRDNAVPFVFGGDGASILVPPSRLEAVKRELVKLRNLAKANYDLELRVGVVPMSEIAAQGMKIEVAKFASGPAKPIAFIRGGGLTWADGLIKSRSETYCVRDEDAGVLGEVKDLTCRWQPLKSRKGKVLSILARSTKNDITIYASILEEMRQILGGRRAGVISSESAQHEVQIDDLDFAEREETILADDAKEFLRANRVDHALHVGIQVCVSLLAL